MKFHIFVLLVLVIFVSGVNTAQAQVDAVVGQVSSSTSESFAGGISGNGRFIVFESNGDHATQFPIEPDQTALYPRNRDGNREIFLFDYAQRRTFQITNTKSLLTNPNGATTFDNVKVEIVNLRPTISNDGRWIVFSSNATTATPTADNATNPGNFDANSFTAMDGTNPLTTNGNTEIWLYEIPTAPPVADLSAGDEIPLVNLSGGNFFRVTNTLPSRLPVPGSSSTFPIIADDNRDSSIDDTGSAISFTSNRDLIAGGNPAPAADNDEIFAYIRAAATLTQITTTPRGSIAAPIYNANSTISNLAAGGWRIAFLSNANNPIAGMTGSNADNNEEIFFGDLDASGALGTNRRQVTTTTRTNPGDVVNVFNYGRRMSRDGRYIAFDSFADLTGSGANQPGFATFVYDTTLSMNAFTQYSVRSNADSAATGGDIQRYPGFTDYDANRSPGTLVLTTRLNIAPNGQIPANASDGLNNDPIRPAQVYSLPLNVPSSNLVLTRLTKLPAPAFFLASIQALPSNSRRRMTFNLAQTEVGTGNPELTAEVFYYLLPNEARQTPGSLNYSTGASRIPVSASPVPTPTATPTPSPSPTVSPTPQTPPAVQGVSPGMLAFVDFNSGVNQPVVARTAVGSMTGLAERRFELPIELSGVTLTVNGAAAGLKSVSQRQIQFVVPPGLSGSAAGTTYPVVINNNGTVIKGSVTLVPARPDIFTTLPAPGPGGRARVFNATNRVLTREPFTITTFRLRGSRRVPTVLRVYLTGVANVASSSFLIRIGSTSIPITGNTAPVQVEPGVYAVDFVLPATIAGAGDQPIVFSAVIGGVTYSSRLDDTAPRLFIL